MAAKVAFQGSTVSAYSVLQVPNSRVVFADSLRCQEDQDATDWPAPMRWSVSDLRLQTSVVGRSRSSDFGAHRWPPEWFERTGRVAPPCCRACLHLRSARGGCFGPWSTLWPPTWCWFSAIPMCPSHKRAQQRWATVLSRASSGPRPWGTSKTCGQAGIGWSFRWLSCLRDGRRNRPKDGAIDPHPVKDHANLPRQSDHGALAAATAGDLRCPCSKPCRASAVHHDGCSLAQGAAQIDIACLGDATRDVALA